MIKPYKSIYKLKEIFDKGSSFTPKGKPKGTPTSGFNWKFPIEYEEEVLVDNQKTKVFKKLWIWVKVSQISKVPSELEGEHYLSTIMFSVASGDNPSPGEYNMSNRKENQSLKVFSSVFSAVRLIYENYMSPLRVYFTFSGVNPESRGAKKAKRQRSLLLDDQKFFLIVKKEDINLIATKAQFVDMSLKNNFSREDIDNPKDDYLNIWKVALKKTDNMAPDLVSVYSDQISHMESIIINHTIDGFSMPSGIHENSRDKQVSLNHINFGELLRLRAWMRENELEIVADNLPNEQEIRGGNQRNAIYVKGAITLGWENVYSAGNAIYVGEEPLPLDSPLRNGKTVERELNYSLFENESFFRQDIISKMEEYKNCTLKRLLTIARAYLKTQLKIKNKHYIIDSFSLGVFLLSKYDNNVRFKKLKNTYDSFSFQVKDETIMIKTFPKRKYYTNIYPSDKDSMLFKNVMKDLSKLKQKKDISMIKIFTTEEGFIEAN